MIANNINIVAAASKIIAMLMKTVAFLATATLWFLFGFFGTLDNSHPTSLTSNTIPSSSPVAYALRQIRTSVLESNSSKAVALCPTPIWIDSGKETYQVVWPSRITVAGSGNKERYKGNGNFPCSGNVAGGEQSKSGQKNMQSCGDDIMKYMHPFIWECRLKERLLAEIENANLSECAYCFLDIGSALGDWVIALAGNSNAKFASAEANPETVLSLLRNFHANGLMENERVHLYPFAVGVSDSSDVGREWITADVIWPEQPKANPKASEYPFRTFAKVLDWPGSSLCMPIESKLNLGGFTTTDLGVLENGDSECKLSETNVPIVSVVDIMNDWQRKDDSGEHSQLAHGGLFAAKVDVEGAEAGVVKSSLDAFTDPKQRPCIMYFEIKTSETYAEAFLALLELGYTDVVDVDSGRTGKDSYPPEGRLYQKEGNYEFKLPAEEFEECIDRVKQTTCHMMQ